MSRVTTVGAADQLLVARDDLDSLQRFGYMLALDSRRPEHCRMITAAPAPADRGS